MNAGDLNSASVTRWMFKLSAGDKEAAGLLWEFVRDRLLQLARNQLRQSAAYDEEDVAVTAFTTLCEGIEDGQFNVDGRTALWHLLAKITVNTARKRNRDENRLKRGGEFARVKSEDALSELTSPGLTPEGEVACLDECQRLLSLLEKDELKLVALLKVEGYTNEEIAVSLGCTRRAIQRRLALIRDFWETELPT